MAYQAQESFHAVLDDGTERFVTKGEVVPDGHELVRRDARGDNPHLFRRLDLDDRLPEPKKAEAKAASGGSKR